jgi:hypothetical protein
MQASRSVRACIAGINATSTAVGDLGDERTAALTALLGESREILGKAR